MLIYICGTMRLGRYRQRNNRHTLNQKPKTMSWKNDNQKYIDDSVSITCAVIIITVSLLIGCLADNL
jgi:uncharacterized membrane protein YkgB